MTTMTYMLRSCITEWFTERIHDSILSTQRGRSKGAVPALVETEQLERPSYRETSLRHWATEKPLEAEPR